MLKKKKNIDLKNILVLVLITTILATCITLSRYKSMFAAPRSYANVGKPIINVDTNQTMTLEAMKPGDTKEYIFSVKNQEGNQTTDTAMAYTIKIETGSFLPLAIELYSVDNGIVGTNNLLSSLNTTGEQQLSIITESHDYRIVVKWLGTDNNYQYSEEIDYIKIIVDSYQINSQE